MIEGSTETLERKRELNLSPKYRKRQPLIHPAPLTWSFSRESLQKLNDKRSLKEKKKKNKAKDIPTCKSVL
jgi:hypothetical protein